MNKVRIKSLIAGVAVLLFLTLVSEGYSADCSLKKFKGNYGLITQGNLVGSTGPRTGVGRLVSDGKGSITSGWLTENNNGTLTSVTFTGFYAVSDDCTGSCQLKFDNADGSTTYRDVEFAIVDSGKEIYGVETSTPTESATTFQLKKQ